MKLLFYARHLFVLRKSQAQQITTNSSLASNDVTAVTVTSISTTAIVIIPSVSSAISDMSFSSPTSILSNSSTSNSQILLPTEAYTGQAILVGTCNIPLFTRLALDHGAYIDVPLVGCSDERPYCCPSLSPPESDNPIITSASNWSTAASSEATATGVVSMLSASPLSICPHDFIDIDPVCCPSGYNLYNQALVGGITPCYSQLSTIMPVPSSISNSIISEAEMTASAVATVSIVVNQVYALGLPCADQEKASQQHHSGLSTGAKVGIGLGVGVGFLLLLALLVLVVMRLCRRRRERKKADSASPRPGDLMAQHTSTMGTTIVTESPYSGQMSPQIQPFVMPYGQYLNASYGAKERVGSWMSQAPTVTPLYPQVPVEMPQGREIYEIDNADNAPDGGNGETPHAAYSIHLA